MNCAPTSRCSTVSFARPKHTWKCAPNCRQPTSSGHREARAQCCIALTPVFSAGLDPLRSGAYKLEDKLRLAGVPVLHDHYPESIHGFYGLDLQESKEVIRHASQTIFTLHSGAKL